MEIFEKKFKLAKEDAADTKGALKRLEGIEYDVEIEQAEEEHAECEQSLEEQKDACEDLKTKIEKLTGEIAEIETKIESIPAEVIDITQVKSSINLKQSALTTAQAKLTEDKKELKDKKSLVVKIDEFLENYDIAELNNKWDKYVDIQEDVETFERGMYEIQKKIDTLDDPGFIKGCKCLHEAEKALAHLPTLEKLLEEKKQERTALDSDVVAENIRKYKSLIEKKDETTRTVTATELQIARNKNTINRLTGELETLRAKETAYEDNKEAIENLEVLLAKKDELDNRLKTIQRSFTKCQEKIIKYHRMVGSLEQKVLNIKEQKNEYIELREQFAAYDLYMRCMHPNGIAYDVIKKKLPVINQEIAKVLSNLTTFEVFFEENGNRLDIFIKHPEYDPRPLSMASGAEKTMAAMAIRLAFLAVSNLPASDIMVLDEPGTALDEEHLQAFTQLLDMIKGYFKTILLISHLDSLKDVVDTTLDISKKEGYAFISQ